MPIARPLYFDYNATTPIDPAVREAMLPFLAEAYGNPSSHHAYGQKAQQAVSKARQHVAALLKAWPEEIIFTGSGTEASNLAIKGSVWPLIESRNFNKQIIISAVEHPATQKPCQRLAKLGLPITVIGVDRYGMIQFDEFKKALERPTALVSVMHSNNEVGTLQPIQEIARLAQQTGALVHCDAAQSVGKLDINVRELEVDLLSVAGHKLYAPKGIGALYVRRGVNLEPVIHGAGQEGGLRAGTENVPYIVGLGVAAELAERSLPQATAHLQQLRDRLWLRLQGELGERVVLNGHPELRLPNTVNVSFLGHVGSVLLAAIPEIAASTGSACHEGLVSLSPVLKAMGIDTAVAQGAVRLSVGRFTTVDEVDQAADLLIKHVMSP